MMGEVLPGLGAVGAAPASPPETSSTPQWGCQEPLVHWGDARVGSPCPWHSHSPLLWLPVWRDAGGCRLPPRDP